jgi:hypothetical protein
MTIDAMKNIDIRTVDHNTLVDVKGVTVNTSLSEFDRAVDYVRQIKNPYCFKCGKTAVKISYADTEVTLEERLERYLLSL